MISFIVPAHNEESMLPRTLSSLRVAADELKRPYEIIVVDDDSTDATSEISLSHGATLVRVAHRQIGAVRNAGAANASGEMLVFVDADTVVPPETLRDAVAAMEDGAIGGGAGVVFDDPRGWWGRAMIGLWNAISRRMRLAAGCFVFVRRGAFEAIGGFDKNYFAGEEIILSTALKQHGRFVVLPSTVITSARKVHLYTKLETLGLMLRLLFSGKKAWQRREGLDMWYRRRTERDGHTHR